MISISLCGALLVLKRLPTGVNDDKHTLLNYYLLGDDVSLHKLCGNYVEHK